MSVVADLAGWLLVTDLDGTLWDTSGRLQPGAREALDTLSAMGAVVLAATGRRPGAVSRAMAANGLLLPAVMFDGALGRDLGNGEIFHLRAFGPAATLPALGALAALGLEPAR